MNEQLNLFAIADDIETKKFSRIRSKKRIRYKTPTYTKKYEVFVDNNGIKQDLQHIYRYRALYLIYGKVAEYSTINPFLWDRTKTDEHKTIGLLRIFKNIYELDKKQCLEFTAEIIGTGRLPFKERLLIHIRLLRLLKQGVELQKACKKSIKFWYKLEK